MASGDSHSSDVAAGLSELECKLRDLERAFTALGHEYDGQPIEPPDTHLAPVPPPAPPPPPAAPPEPEVQSRIDELTRSQERLSNTVDALMADVSRLVDGLAKPPPAPVAPAPVAPPPPPPAPPLTVAAPRTPIHPLPLQVPDDPTPPPPARSVRDYLSNPAAPPPPAADDGA